MTKTDLLTPIRTRGAIPVRDHEVEEAVAPRRVRTRGALRTRGTVAAPAPTLKTQRSLPLEVLFGELREQVGDLPLSILVHGWGSQAAKGFLSVLFHFLRTEDAVWLIPAKQTPDSAIVPGGEGTVMLDLSRATDQRTYRNLVGDIVFFSAAEEADAAQVVEWQQRARALITDSRESQGEAVLWAACHAWLMTYAWSGEAAVDEYTLS